MKVQLFFLLILMSIYGNAQNCKLDIDSIDNVTHIHEYAKQIEILSPKVKVVPHMLLTICKYDSYYFFYVDLGGDRVFTSVRPEDTLVFILDNGKEITAHPDTVYSSDIDRMNNVVRTSIGRHLPTVFEGQYHFDSQNDISKFYSSSVKSIRFYCNYKYRDYILKESFQKDIQEAFNCLK